jgi:hypothetical protein
VRPLHYLRYANTVLFFNVVDTLFYNQKEVNQLEKQSAHARQKASTAWHEGRVFNWMASTYNTMILDDMVRAQRITHAVGSFSPTAPFFTAYNSVKAKFKK